MRTLKDKLVECGACVAVVILVLAVCYGLSWIVTCGVVKLITMCFGLTFKWSIATGIWLIICILKSIFNVTVKNVEPRIAPYMGTNTTNQMLNASQKRRKNMIEMIEKVIRDGGNLHIEPALYGGDIFVCIDFPCRWGLNNATELSDATIVYEGTELKDTIVDICSPGDIRAIAVEDFLTDYAIKNPALLVARAKNLQTALNHLEERLAEWYHLTDAQQKTILLSFAAERKKYLENVVQY